jgi:hypothetical protein
MTSLADDLDGVRHSVTVGRFILANERPSVRPSGAIAFEKFVLAHVVVIQRVARSDTAARSRAFDAQISEMALHIPRDIPHLRD